MSLHWHEPPQDRPLVERLALPVLAIIATIVASGRLDGKLTTLFVAVPSVLAFVSARRELKSAWSMISNSVLEVRARRRHARTIKEIGERFERFVSRGTTDTLHGIIEEQPRHGTKPLLATALPPICLWEFPVQQLIQRLGDPKVSRRTFDRALSELNHHVGTYHTYAVRLVFELARPEEVATWPEHTRRNLDLLSQRLNIFGAEYENAIRSLQRDSPRHANIAWHRMAVAPLTVGLRVVPGEERTSSRA